MCFKDLIIKLKLKNTTKIMTTKVSLLWLRPMLWNIFRITRIRRPTRTS